MTRLPFPDFEKLLNTYRITDRDAASVVGMSPDTVKRWRHGQSDPDHEKVEKAVDAIDGELAEVKQLIANVRRRLTQYKKRGVTEGYESPHARGGWNNPSDRRKPPEIEVSYSDNGAGRVVSIDGEEHALRVRSRPGATVYLLFRDGEVVYVGHSENVYWRLGMHERDKDFDSFAYVEVKDKAEACEVERSLRHQLDPEYNVK